MTISQILDNNDMPAAEKVAGLAKVIAKARTAYGNTDLEITAPKVHTTDGSVPIKLLSDEDKVALASIEIRSILTKVTAGTECTEGVVFDKQIEFYLAINPILANLTAKVESAYL